MSDSTLPDLLRSPSAAPPCCSGQDNLLQRPLVLARCWDDIFTQDTERKQTRAEAEATCAIMRETYIALGCEITELPRTNIASRAEFICVQLAI